MYEEWNSHSDLQFPNDSLYLGINVVKAHSDFLRSDTRMVEIPSYRGYGPALRYYSIL